MGVSHLEPEAFADKGTVLSTEIQRLDRDDPADFYFPLDCDEFVGVDLHGEVHFDREAIEGALRPLREYPGPLMIGCAVRPDLTSPAPAGAIFQGHQAFGAPRWTSNDAPSVASAAVLIGSE